MPEVLKLTKFPQDDGMAEVDVEPGVGHPQRIEDPLPHERKERLARGGFDEPFSSNYHFDQTQKALRRPGAKSFVSPSVAWL